MSVQRIKLNDHQKCSANVVRMYYLSIVKWKLLKPAPVIVNLPREVIHPLAALGLQFVAVKIHEAVIILEVTTGHFIQ